MYARCDTIFLISLDNVSTLIETHTNLEGDRLAKRIYCDNLQQEDLTLREDDFIKFPDPYGPKLRITSALKTFVCGPFSDPLLQIYSSYIWKFICELASNDGRETFSQVNIFPLYSIMLPIFSIIRKETLIVTIVFPKVMENVLFVLDGVCLHDRISVAP